MRKALTLVIFVLICLTWSVQGKRLVKSLPSPKDSKHFAGSVTIRVDDSSDEDYSLSDVSFAGYDKPATSTKETIFITNGTDRTLRAVNVSIDYLDANGRQLHSRTVTLEVEIPGGQTRMATFKSWDTQGSFRYAGSRKSRKETYIYTIKLKPLWYRLDKN